MAPKVASPTNTIQPVPLTQGSFAQFGEVISNPDLHPTSSYATVLANQGSATKHLNVTHMDSHYQTAASQKPAGVSVNMFVCRPRDLARSRRANGDIASSFPVRILERHPFTPQTFVPMGLGRDDPGTRFLVIVAPTLPSTAGRADREPPYPSAPPLPRRRRSLKERLLGARPNPFTNDYSPSTTPPPSQRGPQTPSTRPKGPGLPDLDNLKAFIASGDQAVTYGPGTWHAPMVVLGERPVDFVVVQWANGVGVEDCQEVEIEPAKGQNGLLVEVVDGA
ncbi:ureidoglycolate hydrolase, partial [Polychaeton citri CBS 116435]